MSHEPGLATRCDTEWRSAPVTGPARGNRTVRFRSRYACPECEYHWGLENRSSLPVAWCIAGAFSSLQPFNLCRILSQRGSTIELLANDDHL
jgi:hypothetical protein